MNETIYNQNKNGVALPSIICNSAVIIFGEIFFEMPHELPEQKPFATFLWRITSAHVITYFLAGLLAFQFMNYKELFETHPYSAFMRPMTSPAVAAGPGLQLIRGLIFSMVLWPFTSVFLQTKLGWLKLWALLVGLSILSTAAAAPGSVEGYIYTTIPLRKQLTGYLEVLPQSFLFSLIVYYWYRYPRRAWNIISAICVLLIVTVSLLGVIMS